MIEIYKQYLAITDPMLAKLGKLVNAALGVGICMIGEFNEGFTEDTPKVRSKPEFDPLEYI